MHVLCTVIARSLREVQEVMDYYQDDAWDYVNVGGRYSNIIPVSRRCKLYGGRVAGQELTDGIFPFGPDIDPDPDCRYTSIARLRNVKQGECLRLHERGFLTPFAPYNLILYHEDGGMEFLEWGEMNTQARSRYLDWLAAPHRQSWWMVVLDAHT